jgi:hypothetical protein
MRRPIAMKGALALFPIYPPKAPAANPINGEPRAPPELLVLAMDIGSSSTRAALFDEHGRPFCTCAREPGMPFVTQAE